LAERTRLTQTTTMLGTPAYMSPEQAERTPTDSRTDVWSLGVVLYEMATGRLPFEGEREAAVLYAITQQEQEPITALRAGAPLELDRIVGKALAKRARERYQHVDELLVDLRSLKDSLQSPGSQSRPRAAPASNAGLRKKGLTLAVAAAALIVALTVAWLLQRRPSVVQPAGHRLVSTFPGTHRSASFAPDGSMIAFVSDAGGVPQVWVKNLADGEPIQITSGDAFFHNVGGDAHISISDADGRNLRQLTHGKGQLNTMPRWSGEGSFVYFYQLQPTHSFRKVPLTGGESLEVAPWFWETHNAAQVDPTGRFAVYTLDTRGEQPAALVRDLQNGQETALALPLAIPRWSPGGDSVLGQHRGEIAVCPADGGECDSVTKGVQPVWSGDGSRIFYLDAYREQPELWSATVSGKDQRKIADLGLFRYIDIHFDASPSDQIVYAPWQEGRHELWLADLP